MKVHVNVILLGAGLLISTGVNAQDRDRPNRGSEQQQVRRYEDTAHHDAHEWNERETEAYRHYVQEHRRRYHDYSRASRREREEYWNWRHEHPELDRR